MVFGGSGTGTLITSRQAYTATHGPRLRPRVFTWTASIPPIQASPSQGPVQAPAQAHCGRSVEMAVVLARSASRGRTLEPQLFLSFHWTCTGTETQIRTRVIHRLMIQKNTSALKPDEWSCSFLNAFPLPLFGQTKDRKTRRVNQALDRLPGSRFDPLWDCRGGSNKGTVPWTILKSVIPSGKSNGKGHGY